MMKKEVMIMSKYTTQIRILMKNNFDFNLKSYPIFDENYRNHLNQMILDYYYMNEIEHETASLFNHYLGLRMRLIMPRYNILYEQQTNLLKNISADIVETFTASNIQDKENDVTSDSSTKSLNDIKTSGDSISNVESNTESENRFSSTPMSDVNNLDKYLTNASRDFSDSIDKNTSNTSSDTLSNLDVSNKNSSKATDKTTGKNEYQKVITDPENALKLLNNIRNSFINIDYEIIQELDDLFFKMM